MGIDWFGVVLAILAMVAVFVAVIVAVTAIVFYTWRFLQRRNP